MIFSFQPFAFSSFQAPFCLNSLFYRARIETRSSISEENLQCSQGIWETVSNPYCFDDYMGIMEEGNGGGFKWEQAHSKPQSTAFAPSLDLYYLNTSKREAEESDLVKVENLNQTLSLFLLPAFLMWLSVTLVFGFIFSSLLTSVGWPLFRFHIHVYVNRYT